MAGETFLEETTGETLIDDDGNEFVCDECPCGGCPTDCSSCPALKFTLTGETGCCCTIIHQADRNLTRIGCGWAYDQFGGSPSFELIEYDLACDALTDEWVFDIVIVSYPINCTPNCSAGIGEAWQGKIAAVGGCIVSGSVFSCTHQSGNLCSSTVTVTVNDQ